MVRHRVSYLVVEDDPHFARALARLLRPSGEPIIAETLAAAKSLTEARRFEAAIVDLTLPDGSGFDALRALRACQPEARAMVLTASTDRDSIHTARDLGAEYSVKPLDAARITRFVAQCRATRPEQAAERVAHRYGLSPSEKSVLARVLRGATTKEIAEARRVSPATVRKLKERLLRKTKSPSAFALVTRLFGDSSA